MPLYFAYGSNMKISDLDADLRGRSNGAECIVETSPALLRGWRLVWNYFSKSRAWMLPSALKSLFGSYSTCARSALSR